MDSKDKKLEKKLARVANQIKKSRKDKEAVKKEAKEFDEIKKLLEISDDEESFPDEKENNVEKIDILPLEAPSIEIFKVKKLFSLFDQETLKCDAFLNPEEKSFIFGKDINELSEDKIRYFIQQGLAEIIASDTDKCKFVSLYVFYLLSVHSNLKFVKACFEFLKQRRFTVPSDVVLTVLVNYGTSVEKLCDSSFELCDFPFECRSVKGRKIRRFPYLNMKTVADLLIDYAKNKQIRFDLHSKHLIKALGKITLDPYVKSSGLSASFSTLLSFLAAEAVNVYGSYEVATWLHLENVSYFEQIEICKSLNPVSEDLQHELVLRNIDEILKPKNSCVTPIVKVKDIKRILEELKKKPFDITEYYCLCQLILILLPFVDVTVKELQEINLLLGALERKIVNIKDSTDILRIKLDIAKIQNLVTSKTDNRHAVNESIELSPVKPVRGFR